MATKKRVRAAASGKKAARGGREVSDSNVTKIVHVRMPYELWKMMDDRLRPRGTTVESYLKMQATIFDNAPRALELDDTMTFGKYRNAGVEMVIRSDPEYVVWALSTVERFKLSREALALLEGLDRAADGADSTGIGFDYRS